MDLSADSNADPFYEFIIDESHVEAILQEADGFENDEELAESEDVGAGSVKLATGGRKRAGGNSKRPGPKKPRKIKNEEEKKLLAGLMKQEELIWNKQHELHSNLNALSAAWNLVAAKIPSTTVGQCKVMWKSLRDALRYKRKTTVKGKSGDSGDDEPVDDIGEESELSNLLSFLTPTTVQFPRETSVLGTPKSEPEDSGPFDSYDVSPSNYSYVPRKEKKDGLSESVQSISKSIDQLVTVATSQSTTSDSTVILF